MRIALYLVLSCALASCATGDLREPQEDDGVSEPEDTRPIDVGGGPRDIGGLTDIARDVPMVDVGIDADDPDSTTEPDAAPGCPDPTTDCGGFCVNLETDLFNCGACNRVCMGGEVCDSGQCGESCGGGLVSCGGDCVNPSRSIAHCGECDNACRPGESCVDGACSLGCGTGELECNGECVDVTNDDNNCGGCGVTCSLAQVCEGSGCVCRAPQQECDGRCVDVTTSLTNCGACNATCDSNETCRAGDCACAAGFQQCGDACVDTRVDGQNCGACGDPCDDDQVCLDSECIADCEDEQIVCDNRCIDPATSEANCGACGDACAPGQFCEGGECDCPDGATNCSGECRDLQNDDDACGACGESCRADQACDTGSCECPAGFGECGGACLAFDDDPANCGACGETCSGDELCREGACVCSVGTADCGSGCVDISSDPSNCGTCGERCEDDFLCIDGACTDECPAGTEPCDEDCVVTGSDEENCGACGVVCEDLESCLAGTCACDNDHLEPNNMLSTATLVAAGSSQTTARRGSQLADLIMCADEVDSYRFLTPGDTGLIEITVTGDCETESTGLLLQLNSPSGVSLASSSSGGAGTCPTLSYRTPDTGLHELQVTGGGESSHYHLNIRVTEITELEDNGGRGSATGPISRTSSYIGGLNHDYGFFTDTEDIEYFALQIVEVTDVVIETQNTDSGCDFDSVIVLFDDDGNVLIEDDDGGSNLCSRIETTLTPGNYTVRVRDYTGDSLDEFSYRLNITTGIRQESEPNDTSDFANDLGAAPTSVEAALQANGDVDRYRFSLGLTSDVVLETSGVTGSCTTDTIITLFDSAGTVLGSDDDGSDAAGFCSRIARTLPPGEYVVEVSGYANARRGAYVLNITAQ
jgi:hypothetical protein